MGGEVGRLLFRSLGENIVGLIVWLAAAAVVAAVFGFLLARVARVVTGGLAEDPAEVRKYMAIGTVVGAGGAMLFGSFFV
jgi:uncharacterized membrane protein